MQNHAATTVINILCVGRKFVYQINSSFDHIRYSSKGTTPGNNLASLEATLVRNYDLITDGGKV